MSDKLNVEMGARLPKWAQQRIIDLTRERDTALKSLNKWVDEQTPAPFSIEEYLCTGEATGPVQKVRYIQSYKMKVVHAGVELNIMLREDGNNGPARICLQWNDPNRLCNRLAFVPVSFQSAELISKDNIQ